MTEKEGMIKEEKVEGWAGTWTLRGLRKELKTVQAGEGVKIQEMDDGSFEIGHRDELVRMLDEKNARIEKLRARVSDLSAKVDRLEEARDVWLNKYLQEAAKNDEQTMAVTIEKLKDQLAHGDERKQEYLRRLEELDDWFNQ